MLTKRLLTASCTEATDLQFQAQRLAPHIAAVCMVTEVIWEEIVLLMHSHT